MYFYNNLAQSASEEYIPWCEESLHGYSSQVCDEKEEREKRKRSKNNEATVACISSTLGCKGPNSTVISVLFIMFLFCLQVQVKWGMDCSKVSLLWTTMPYSHPRIILYADYHVPPSIWLTRQGKICNKSWMSIKPNDTAGEKDDKLLSTQDFQTCFSFRTGKRTTAQTSTGFSNYIILSCSHAWVITATITLPLKTSVLWMLNSHLQMSQRFLWINTINEL